MSKHSHYPWKSRQNAPDEIEILDANGGILFRSTSYGRMRDDAHLIAAAPEMLVLLKTLVERYELLGTSGTFYDEVKASIKKAEGK